MSLCRSNQQLPGIYTKCNRLLSGIKLVAKDMNRRAVLPDHIAGNGCSCMRLMSVNSNERQKRYHVSA